MGLKSDKLFKKFSHQFVEIITKLSMESTIQTETHTEIMKQPVMVKGFLLDKDLKYYYLGENAIDIDRSIKILDITYIQLSKPYNPHLELLNGIPSPQNEEEFN